MGESRETKQESFRAEERKELCFLQIDIVGHSKIPGSDLRLKRAKNIFYSEITRIAVAHGGEHLNWAGDGGSFMYPTEDGEGFNRLVKAALVMLFSMPAINKKIATETDLRDNFRVRISCDSGNVAFDQVPGLITGGVLNDFFKNEREISLADTICITERVHKQLDPQLSAHFRLYTHSPAIDQNIYTLIENPRVILIENPQIPPTAINRWKTFLVGMALVIALGFACGVMVGKYVWGKDKDVRIAGSGTVYYYLEKLDPQIFENLSDRTHLNVRPLPMPTSIGAEMFAQNFEPNTNQPDLFNVIILVMASRQLNIGNLSRQLPSGSGTIPQAVFEVYLGADTLQALLVTSDTTNAKYEKDREAALKQDFPEFFDSVKKKEPLTFAAIATLLNSPHSDYKDRFYMGTKKSATRCLWEAKLSRNGVKDELLESIYEWNIQETNFINVNSTKAHMYLGSAVLIDELERRVINNLHERLTVVDEANNQSTQQKRGLYLYGFLDVSKESNHKEKDGKESDGYNLPEHVTEILRYVLDKLEQNPDFDKDCLKNQRDYFHLDSETGWIAKKDKMTVYRDERCTPPVEPKVNCD